MGSKCVSAGMAGLLLVGLLPLVGCVGTSPTESRVDFSGVVTGDSLEGLPSERLIELMGDDLPWTRLSAAKVLAEEGASSVPIFLKLLEDDDWRVVRAAEDGILALLKEAEEEGAGKDEAVREAAVAGIPALVKVLKHEHYYVRMGALQCFTAMGQDAAPAGDAICDSTEDKDFFGVLPAAFKAIRAIGPSNFNQDRLFMVMENSVKGPHVDARRAAIGLIERLDEADQRKLVPALLYALDNQLLDGYTRYHVQAQIARLLQKLDVKETLPRIVAILEIKGWGESHRVKQFMPLLVKYGPDAADALPFLEDYVRIFKERRTNSDLIVLINQAIDAIKNGGEKGEQRT